jgi:hypothetical protein
MSTRSLEEKLDLLYAADPSEFVALRKQLQGELRAAGDKPEALLLGRARRPSTSMWAMNQLVRRRPELVDALLERGAELRSVQTQPRGNREAVQEAIRAHRTALADATAAAVDVLGPRANDAFREDILTALRAASIQSEIGRELRRGRLVRSDDLTSGFPEPGAFASESAETRLSPGRTATKDSRKRPPTRREEAHEKLIADSPTRAIERETRRRLDHALQEQVSEESAAGAAQRRVDELREQLTSARAELRDAEARARKARAEAARLAARLERG